MGGSSNAAQQGNYIAQASLNEQRRQYNEQKAKENSKKEVARANATGVRQSANKAYSNTASQATDFTSGENGYYSLFTAGGTPSVLNTMLSGDQENNKLG